MLPLLFLLLPSIAQALYSYTECQGNINFKDEPLLCAEIGSECISALYDKKGLNLETKCISNIKPESLSLDSFLLLLKEAKSKEQFKALTGDGSVCKHFTNFGKPELKEHIADIGSKCMAEIPGESFRTLDATLFGQFADESFYGLTKAHVLNMSDDVVQQIKKGVFDNLPSHPAFTEADLYREDPNFHYRPGAPGPGGPGGPNHDKNKDKQKEKENEDEDTEKDVQRGLKDMHEKKKKLLDETGQKCSSTNACYRAAVAYARTHLCSSLVKRKSLLNKEARSSFDAFCISELTFESKKTVS